MKNLSKVELFCELSEKLQKNILSKATRVNFVTDQIILKEGDPASKFYVLLNGEIRIEAAGKLVGLQKAPKIIGLFSIIDLKSRSATVIARSSCECLQISKEFFDKLQAEFSEFSEALLKYILKEVRSSQEQNKRMLKSFEDFFESPNARIYPGPYFCDAFKQYFIVMKEDPKKIAALLPPGLKPLPLVSGRYIAAINFFPGLTIKNKPEKSFSYREFCIFIPCIGPDLKVGFFCPELYPDNYLAIVIGREVYGFPKRHGALLVADDEIDFVLNQNIVFRFLWEKKREVEGSAFIKEIANLLFGNNHFPEGLAKIPAIFLNLCKKDSMLQTKLPVYIRKQIPHATCDGKRTLEIDKLVRVDFKLYNFKKYSLIDNPQLNFVSKDFFIGGESQGAVYFEMGLEFGQGVEIFDYQLKTKKKRLRLLWKKVSEKK
jgi:CRP-like cAMP-binding protein